MWMILDQIQLGYVQSKVDRAEFIVDIDCLESNTKGIFK